MMIKTIKILLLIGFISLIGGCERQSSTDDNQIAISGYYGKYRVTAKHVGHAASNLKRNDNDLWLLNDNLAKEQPVSIGVLFPNQESNDPYWQLVREGIEKQSKQNNYKLTLLSSDSYSHIEQHKQQFKQLAVSHPDAIIIGAIHYRAMDDLIAKATNGHFGKSIPVIAVINDVEASEVSGKVMVSFTNMGQKAGKFVLKDAKSKNRDRIRVALLPGPINSGWAPESLTGFVNAVRNYPGELDLIEPLWGSPTPAIQKQLLKQVLYQNNHIDYIVGNAVAATEAIELLKLTGLESEITVVSTYYSPSIAPLLEQGYIAAAPSDQPNILGRIAVSMVAKNLAGQEMGKDIPFRVSPDIPIITAKQTGK